MMFFFQLLFSALILGLLMGSIDLLLVGIGIVFSLMVESSSKDIRVGLCLMINLNLLKLLFDLDYLFGILRAIKFRADMIFRQSAFETEISIAGLAGVLI